MTGWFWWSLAAVLLIIELLLPGVFMIWFALAALTVAGLLLFMPLSWPVAAGIFAGLALVYTYGFYPHYQRFLRKKTHNPNLNVRESNYMGQVFTLQHALINGRGQLQIADSLWEITGPDIAAGQRVKVVGFQNMQLQVIPAE